MRQLLFALGLHLALDSSRLRDFFVYTSIHQFICNVNFLLVSVFVLLCSVGYLIIQSLT